MQIHIHLGGLNSTDLIGSDAIFIEIKRGVEEG